ncbi:hypothetical protein H1C71_010584 [Ictidomys tridecemlineatus]|nr:hypothetical protein H1C71_010584 [Ictidomys tridecemlineatus]
MKTAFCEVLGIVVFCLSLSPVLVSSSSIYLTLLISLLLSSVPGPSTSLCILLMLLGPHWWPHNSCWRDSVYFSCGIDLHEAEAMGMILLGHGKTGVSVDCRNGTRAVDWFYTLIRRSDAMDGVHVKGDKEVCTREYLCYFF